MKKGLVGLVALGLPLLSGCSPAWLLGVLLLLQGSSPAGLSFDVPALVVGQGALIVVKVLAPAGKRVQGLEVSPWAGDFLGYDPAFLQLNSVEAVPPWRLDAVNVDAAQGRVYFVARASPDEPFPSRGPVLRLQVKPLRSGRTALAGSLTQVADGANLPLDLPVLEKSFSIR